jgi:hypothetical protein
MAQTRGELDQHLAERWRGQYRSGGDGGWGERWADDR